MQRIAFKMKLHPNQAAEYKRRHDAIWPELAQLLRQNGIADYSIFLDEETNALFGVLKIADPAMLDRLPQHEIMQRWWRYMADIMETREDQAPLQTPLRELFYLP